MSATKFIGNVLPATGESPEGDSTFDFTNNEAQKIDLTGVPIRIEHADTLPIGRVTKQWTKPNGEKWIMGELDSEKGLAHNYANHAIRKDSRGHTLYTGLSLQHVHQQWSDGTSVKRPVEISICTEPRRPDCYIRAVSETKKKEYIAHKASDNSRMSEQLQTPETNSKEETQNVVDAVGEVVTTTEEQTKMTPEEENARATVGSHDELMKMFLAQDQKSQEMEAIVKKLSEEKAVMEKKWQEREENEQLQTKSKAEALSHALVESWQNTLPAGDLTEDNKKAIFALAQNFPQESVQMMEIAHKASLKHREHHSALVDERATSQKRELENQVVNTIMKRRKLDPAPQTTVHQASTKKEVEYNPFTAVQQAPNTRNTDFCQNNKQLFSALKGLSAGNAKSMMDNIAKYRNSI